MTHREFHFTRPAFLPGGDLNNRLEGDHGKLKRLMKLTLGFQSMKTAYATIKGFEVMRMFKKGQFAPWIDAICGGTEVHFINRLFGLYA
jgi:hypothetical protein